MNREEYYTTGWLKANGFNKVELIPNLGIIADNKNKRMLIVSNTIDFQKSERLATQMNRELWSVRVDPKNNIIWNQLKEEKHKPVVQQEVQYVNYQYA